MSAHSGRGNSSPWGRLKAVNLDPLEAIGLPSKGDKRLLDLITQESYYTKIVERYMAFCSNAGDGDELQRRLAQVEVSTEKNQSENQPLRKPNTTTSAANNGDGFEQRDIPVLMMAMRKLREGIIASKRVDGFSIQVYIFCIRFSILLKHMESYHPAILHLLRIMHPILPLTNTELQEFVAYLVLDLACRQNDLAQAFQVRHTYALHDTKVNAVLRSLVQDDYHLFWRVKRSVDGHKAKLMEFAEEGIRRQTLKCLGRSYLSIDLYAVEQYTGSSWAALVKDHAVGWQLEGTKVVIRKPKAR